MPFPTGGHFGRDKTIEKVCSRVYWGKNMTAEVKEYVRTCDVCQRVNDKFQKPPAELHPIPVSPEVWKQVTFWCRPYIFDCMQRTSNHSRIGCHGHCLSIAG